MMTDRTTGTVARLLQGLAVGAVAMYFLDPDKGRRRRALARDQINRIGCDIADLAHDATRDTTNRLQGVRARVDRRINGEAAVDELRLIERVRAALGRVVAHPHAVQVGAMRGTIQLSGPVLTHEVPVLLATVRGVPGVTDVENHFDVHTRADIPALQGQRRQRRGQTYPMPAVRLSALVSGGVLALYALRRDGIVRLAAIGAGLALANRALYGMQGPAQRVDGGDVHAEAAAPGEAESNVIHAGRPARGNGASGQEATSTSSEKTDEPPAGASRPPATH
jgi:hypothetical protein